jgi:DNA-binding MarR family transcriptional regulator
MQPQASPGATRRRQNASGRPLRAPGGVSAAADHGRLLMGFVHHATALNSGRPTIDLNLRQRLVIQRLGLVGEAPMAAVGQYLGFSPSTMTGLVDRLEGQDYVRRQPHPTDRRATHLALTKKGRRVFEHEVAFYRSLADQVLGVLPAADRPRILDAFARVAAADQPAAA